MTYHVDVIQADWSAGVERLAARLVLRGNDVEIADVSSDNLPPVEAARPDPGRIRRPGRAR